MNKLILIIFSSSLLFAATTEEITQYLSFSQSEQQVLSIERVFDSMRQQQENNESNQSTNQTSIVYQEYLEEHLSSNEIEKILALYRLPIMERYVSEIKTFNINQEDMDAFLENLKEEPLSSEREDIVNEIVKNLVNEELQLNFYRSMMQRYQPLKKPKKVDDNASKLSSREKGYIDSMKESAKNHLLYGSQILGMEEMIELKKALSSSIFQKVKRVENEALIQIMNNYIQGIVSKPKELEEKKEKK